ncbi:Transcriptional regulator, contains XRE-family HTH domain [Streptomyces sp. Termitarium-T10T-6]|nr:helix-turn-helix transcriptional regulator [Streptomyces sp. Termitarium-T10T-6]SCE62277.1 Transcriptional regulator, contains XRE-family HTH domain [Streptomyces sp. Termitarium-T10T-6]
MDAAERGAGTASAGESGGTRLPPGDFGVVLATLRARRGWSVREAARRANVSEGQICNLESGLRNPSPAVAAACDAAFGAGGELVELAGSGRRGTRDDSVVDSGPAIAGYERVLGELKGIGRSTGPRFVTASIKSIIRILTDTGQRAVGEQRAEIWLLASRFAEYAGWMAQESGNSAEALRWTNLAVRWGANGGDETVAAYALTRKAFIAQHRGDPGAAIGFADQAARHPAANPVIRAHAARRAALGHASRGDAGACRDALERFRSHTAEDTGGRPPHWGPRIGNGSSHLLEASCLLGLRRFGPAADLFASACGPAVPSDSNSRARFAVRQATALAGIDRLDDACRIVDATLPTIRLLDSATLRAELARFVAEARPRGTGPGELALIDTSAALASG